MRMQSVEGAVRDTGAILTCGKRRERERKRKSALSKWNTTRNNEPAKQNEKNLRSISHFTNVKTREGGERKQKTKGQGTNTQKKRIKAFNGMTWESVLKGRIKRAFM